MRKLEYRVAIIFENATTATFQDYFFSKEDAVASAWERGFYYPILYVHAYAI